MKNPLMFKPQATPNRAQGLPGTAPGMPGPMQMGENPMDFYLKNRNPLSTEFAQANMVKQSPIPMMASPFGPVPVPAGGLPGGGGGGGGGRGPSFGMGRQEPRQKIMRLGPRTASEFYGETAGRPPMPGAAPAGPPASVPGGNPADAPDGYLPMEQLAWNDETGRQPQPAMMARGGKLPTGKPVLVGEEGPELILPRDDGTGFVLPADVTDDVLPMMMRDVKPRKDGGKIAYRAEGGPVPMVPGVVYGTAGNTFTGFTSPYGSGEGTNIPTRMMTETARRQMFPENRFLADERYMADPAALAAGNNATMPLLPDFVEGPWAMPGAPAPERGPLQERIGAQLDKLRDFENLSPVQVPQMVTDQVTGEQIPQSEMLQRVSMRGQVHAGEIGARREAADRARLAALPPIGTRPPGIDPTQRRMDRQMERFMRTPQGMMFALEQGQQGQLANQRAQLASTALPVTDPATGQVMGWTNGLGASLPSPAQATNKRMHSQREVNGVLMNFYTDGTSEPAAPDAPAAAAPVLAWDGSKVVTLPPGIDPATLPVGLTLLNQRPRTEMGGATTAPSPGSPTPATAPMTVSSKEQYDQLPKGAKYIWNGKELTKQ